MTGTNLQMSSLCLCLRMLTFLNAMDIKPVSLYTIFLLFLLYITIPNFYNPPEKSDKNIFLADKWVSVSLSRHFVHHIYPEKSLPVQKS